MYDNLDQKENSKNFDVFIGIKIFLNVRFFSSLKRKQKTNIVSNRLISWAME